MATHKNKPRLKKYKKLSLDYSLSKKKFYPVDLQCISTKFSERLSQDFTHSLQNSRKFKFLYKFSKTSSLKKLIKRHLIKNKNKWSFLKEKELFSIFESRLDIILFRLNFVSSLFEAKQLISHGKVVINSKVNHNFSYLVKKGDIISFKKSSHVILKDRLADSFSKFNFYSFDNLEVCYKTFKIIVLAEKLNLKKQLHHYPYFLNWSKLMEI
jgi:ribosomal protein S4